MSEERLREYIELVRTTRHDANSPLTAALGNVQLALEEPTVQNDPEVLESLRAAESELRRLAGILARLKDVR